MSADKCARAPARRMKADARGKLGKSLVDEVIADMHAVSLHARVGRELPSLACKLQRGLRHLPFSAIGAAGNDRNALAIQFAGFEIHLLKYARRVLAQEHVEGNERLDEIEPVGVADGSQTLDVGQQQRDGRSSRESGAIRGPRPE